MNYIDNLPSSVTRSFPSHDAYNEINEQRNINFLTGLILSLESVLCYGPASSLRVYILILSKINIFKENLFSSKYFDHFVV